MQAAGQLTTLVYAIPLMSETTFGFKTQISPKICPVPRRPIVEHQFSLPLSPSWTLLLLVLLRAGWLKLLLRLYVEPLRRISFKSLACFACLMASAVIGTVTSTELRADEEAGRFGDDFRVILR